MDKNVGGGAWVDRWKEHSLVPRPPSSGMETWQHERQPGTFTHVSEPVFDHALLVICNRVSFSFLPRWGAK